jgi:cytochrome c556
MLRKLVFAGSAIALLVASAASGADDPIAQRRQVMKMNGKAAGTAFKMIKGEDPYDAAKAAEAMKTLQDDLTVFPTLFPEGSDQGDTNASPEIWKNMDDFKALAAKLVTDAKAAETAAADGIDAFKAAFDTVGQDCGACHTKYRLKKS